MIISFTWLMARCLAFLENFCNFSYFLGCPSIKFYVVSCGGFKMRPQLIIVRCRFKQYIQHQPNWCLYLQVYFQLDEGRKQSGRSDVAICRIEQLCPFPYDLVQRELKRYPSTVWSITQFNIVSIYVSMPLDLP